MSSNDVSSAVSILLDLTTAAVALSTKIQKVSTLIQKAQMEGRDKFTDAEWKEITGMDDDARKRLEDAIKAAEAGQQ